MESDDLVDRVHSLSDLELALLLSLVNQQHCVVGTPLEAVDDLVDELSLAARRVFGLRCAVVDCHEQTTLEDFASSLRAVPSNHHAFLSSPSSPPSSSSSSASPIAHVVLARHLNRAPKVVQIQALDLLHTRRILTHTAMQAAPKPFLLVAVVAAERGFRWNEGHHHRPDRKDEATTLSPHLVSHLNDAFAMAHWHDPEEDGFPNLEEEDEKNDNNNDNNNDDENDSNYNDPPFISPADVARLADLAAAVRVDTDVLRYQINVVAFLRLHRAVASCGLPGAASSASAAATRHFVQLVRSLAPLHRLDYVTPALVRLAAHKAYLHRLRTVATNKNTDLQERSLQWGSDRPAVAALLRDISPADIIDDVLATVPPPV